MASKANSSFEKEYAGWGDGKPKLHDGDVSQASALYSSIFTSV